MKTTTVRQLRHDFGSVMAWVEEGEQVGISKRGKLVALLSPPRPAKPTLRRKRPDFAARLKRNYGDTVLAGDVIVEERNERQF